jgi:hypothetical protein
LHRNGEYLLAEVSGLEPAGHRVLAMRPFGERMEVGYIRIAIGQLILRLVPPAAGSAFGPRAMMALVAHSMVWRSTPGVRFPDASPMLRARPQASARIERERDPGDGMSWQLLVEFVVSIAYGGLSSLIPIFNSEIYIAASQVGGFAEEATTAVGCALGLSIGKVGTVLALRRGASFKWMRRMRDRPRRPAGKFRTRLRGWTDRMMGLLGESQWGVAIVFLSACVYVPPL